MIWDKLQTEVDGVKVNNILFPSGAYDWNKNHFEMIVRVFRHETADTIYPEEVGINMADIAVRRWIAKQDSPEVWIAWRRLPRFINGDYDNDLYQRYYWRAFIYTSNPFTFQLAPMCTEKGSELAGMITERGFE